MRVLVYPHDLELGGSSINAVDLAAAVRRYGHETMLIARPGPLAERARELGVDLVPMRLPARPRPWPGAVRDVRATIARFGADLVHSYEYWPCVESTLAARSRRVPVLATILTMGWADYLPRTVPMTLGYRDQLDAVARRQRAPVHLLEPPIDTVADAPGRLDVSGFAAVHDLGGDDLDVVIVSRVSHYQKQEGIERAVDAVARLARSHPVRIVVVGGGSAYEDVRRRADRVNATLGRRVVVLTGRMSDPRPAYELADVVVGMGSSALRGMAFGKPVVVVGVDGFSLPVAPETIDHFRRAGYYGEGTGRPAPDTDPLVAQIRPLLADAALRRRLGEFGRRLVVEDYSLEVAASRLDRIYREVAQLRESRLAGWADLITTVERTAAHKLRDRRARMSSRVSA